MILQEHSKLLEEQARLKELGKQANTSYSRLLASWRKRVDPGSRRPRRCCPQSAPVNYLKLLEEDQQRVFKADYRLWQRGKFADTKSGAQSIAQASEEFLAWLNLTLAPMSRFVPEQRAIEEWHERRQQMTIEAEDLCRSLEGQVAPLMVSIRSIRAKSTTKNQEAKTTALELLDQAAQVLRTARPPSLDTLKRVAAIAENLVQTLWRTEYGSHLSRELAIKSIESAVRSGKLDPQQTGMIQRNIVEVLDREGVPVPQHVKFAASSWSEAFQKRAGRISLKAMLSRWQGEAIRRVRMQDSGLH